MMTANDFLQLAVAGVVGIALGTVFFGGLWWTIRHAVESSNPALWFLGSLLARMAIVLAGFYLIALDDWQRLIACLAGFILARLVVTRLTRPDRELIRAP